MGVLRGLDKKGDHLQPAVLNCKWYSIRTYFTRMTEHAIVFDQIQTTALNLRNSAKSDACFAK